MAVIGEKEVARIAKLSRISLTPEEAIAEQRDLSQILDYMEKLNELDTSSVSPTFAEPIDVAALRADCARESYPNDALMANAPESEDGAYRVPNVVEE